MLYIWVKSSMISHRMGLLWAFYVNQYPFRKRLIMAVTPGSKDKLNDVIGVAKIIPVTDAEIAGDLGDRKFDEGFVLLKSDGTVLITDGKTALKDLPVRIDQALTVVEKTALSKAFDAEGKYQAVEGGVVLHGADGKIADTALNLIGEDGLLKLAYLASILDPETGLLKLTALPDSVRAGIHYFANYAAMAAATDPEVKRGISIVLDASDDPSGTVTKGAASYGWEVIPPEEEGVEPTGRWMKIAEVESLDIDIDALKPDYDNVQAAGAIMYDHPLCIGGMTLTELAALQAGSSEEDPEEDA